MDITLERILSLLPKDKKGNIKRGAKMNVPKARKLPSGSWNIQMRLGGRSVSVTRFSERACILEAERIKAAYRATGSITEGNDAKGEKSEQQGPTVADAIQHYIDSRRNVLSPSTLRAYTTMAHNRWKAINQRVVEHFFFIFSHCFRSPFPRCTPLYTRLALPLCILICPCRFPPHGGRVKPAPR